MSSLDLVDRICVCGAAESEHGGAQGWCPANHEDAAFSAKQTFFAATCKSCKGTGSRVAEAADEYIRANCESCRGSGFEALQTIAAIGGVQGEIARDALEKVAPADAARMEANPQRQGTLHAIEHERTIACHAPPRCKRVVQGDKTVAVAILKALMRHGWIDVKGDDLILAVERLIEDEVHKFSQSQTEAE